MFVVAVSSLLQRPRWGWRGIGFLASPCVLERRKRRLESVCACFLGCELPLDLLPDNFY